MDLLKRIKAEDLKEISRSFPKEIHNRIGYYSSADGLYNPHIIYFNHPWDIIVERTQNTLGPDPEYYCCLMNYRDSNKFSEMQGKKEDVKKWIEECVEIVCKKTLLQRVKEFFWRN